MHEEESSRASLDGDTRRKSLEGETRKSLDASGSAQGEQKAPAKATITDDMIGKEEERSIRERLVESYMEFFRATGTKFSALFVFCLFGAEYGSKAFLDYGSHGGRKTTIRMELETVPRRLFRHLSRQRHRHLLPIDRFVFLLRASGEEFTQ